MHLEKAYLASHLFPPGLLVVHDAYTGCQNDLSKLQAPQPELETQLHDLDDGISV